MKLPENWSDVVTLPSAGDADVLRRSGLPATERRARDDVIDDNEIQIFMLCSVPVLINIINNGPGPQKILPKTAAPVHSTRITTSSSTVAKRPLDALCPSVVSFNSTKRRVVCYC